VVLVVIMRRWVVVLGGCEEAGLSFRYFFLFYSEILLAINLCIYIVCILLTFRLAQFFVCIFNYYSVCLVCNLIKSRMLISQRIVQCLSKRVVLFKHFWFIPSIKFCLFPCVVIFPKK